MDERDSRKAGIMQRFFLCWILCLLSTAGPLLAVELGDPAPALDIAKWAKGKSVDLKAGKGKEVYIVEFWATWCPPCRKAIPHLTEIQKKYKDKGVVVVGVTGEEPDVVDGFLKETGDQMDFTVAIDRNDTTGKAYMMAFGIDGIPHAFIIDKEGRLAWHGHPEASMDKMLEEILAGKYDLDAARRTDKTQRLMNQYFGLIVKADRIANEKEKGEILKNAAEVGGEVVKVGAKSADLLDGFAWTILDSPQIRTRDRELALKAAKVAYDATEGKEPSILDTYARALFDTGKKAEAIPLLKKAIELCKNERMLTELKKTLERYEKEAGEKTG